MHVDTRGLGQATMPSTGTPAAPCSWIQTNILGPLLGPDWGCPEVINLSPTVIYGKVAAPQSKAEAAVWTPESVFDTSALDIYKAKQDMSFYAQVFGGAGVPSDNTAPPTKCAWYQVEKDAKCQAGGMGLWAVVAGAGLITLLVVVKR